MTIFTIGYEGVDIDSFVAVLSSYNIEVIVDVREIPLSRKPGFSKKSLESKLNLSGKGYLHMVDLGCPKPVRNRYREDGDWQRYTDGFLRYLKTQDAAVVELAELAASANCALMCFEADSNFCHRSFVADAVKEYSGVSVTHIHAKKALLEAFA
jgi:uncharacterized protein (DUF488 family)